MDRNAEDLLNAISWENLHTSHGDASAVPAAVRLLAGAATREETDVAYWQLDNVVVVQGQVFDSALALIPVLLTLLGGELNDPISARVLDLLFELQGGDLHEDEIRRNNVSLGDRCTDALAGGLPLYWESLGSEDALVRRTATDLIGSLEPDANRRTLALERSATDSDVAVRKSARWWLACPEAASPRAGGRA